MAKISNEIVAPKRARKNNSRPTLDRSKERKG